MSGPSPGASKTSLVSQLEEDGRHPTLAQVALEESKEVFHNSDLHLILGAHGWIAPKPDRQRQEVGITYTLLGYLGRGFFGIILSMPLGLLGVLLGWGSFLMFASPTDWHFWFWSVIGGAGVLASVGAGLPWLLGTSPRPALASIALFVVTAVCGIVGAYAGYHWGEGVRTPCCAQPDNSVFGYTASGAMAGALLSATILGIIGQRLWRLPRPPYLLRSSDNAPSPTDSDISMLPASAAASMASSAAMGPMVRLE